MSDLENELREVLKAKADRLPPQRSVPRRMIRRARRRVAVSALSGMVVAAALVVGGVSGLRALSGPPVQVGHTPTPSVATLPGPSPSTTTPQLTESMCSSTDLAASFRRPKGAVFGSIDLTNQGEVTCSLEGIPTVTLLDDSANPYQTDRRDVDPFWVVNGASQPPSWPEVKLAAGASARIRVAVTNWCYTGLASWELEFSGDGTIQIDRVPGLSYVQCTKPESPATVQVGPVEPSA